MRKQLCKSPGLKNNAISAAEIACSQLTCHDYVLFAEQQAMQMYDAKYQPDAYQV